MKTVICYEDNNGRRYNTPEDAANADRVLAMRKISSDLIEEWATREYGSWQPGAGDLSVILQRLATSKGFSILRKVQAIQRRELRDIAQHRTTAAR